MNNPEKYNVVWHTPSENSAGSMPIGNGDVGLNVWVEPSGDLLIYIGKTDSWCENGRLLKLGRLRVKLDPNPFAGCVAFKQELKLAQGVIELSAGSEGKRAVAKIWVDAHRPVAHIEMEGDVHRQCEIALELWRTSERPLRVNDMNKDLMQISDGSYSELGFIRDGIGATVYPDLVLSDRFGAKNELVWCHRNEASIWGDELRHQGMGQFADEEPDPLLQRTFGGSVRGAGFTRTDAMTLSSICPALNHSVCVYMDTKQTSVLEDWVEGLRGFADEAERIGYSEALREHENWWSEFWNRSWMNVGGGAAETDAISRGWHLHRYLVACAGRGRYPLKFNGSIFNVDGDHQALNAYSGQGYDADYRAWGGAYWFQNQRQIYWPMLAAGDYDSMLPFFRMYLEALPFVRSVTREWFGHDGAFFPETMRFWGGHTRSDYGSVPAFSKTDKLPENGYTKRYWQSGLEIVSMMLDYAAHTKDEAFFRETVIPIAEAVLEFYEHHYPRERDGTLRIEPAQALETLWNVINPTPELAGLRRVLTGLLDFGTGKVSKETLVVWGRLLGQLPPLPFKRLEPEGSLYLDACETNLGSVRNLENAALYSVFPYRQFGPGKEGLSSLRDTYTKRPFQENYHCWANDNVFAAYLGLAEEARIQLSDRFSMHGDYRFPAFYVNGDWVPDHDNGGVSQQTIQAMVMQADGDVIRLLPAWPKEWDVDFKLHAPNRTTVEGRYRGGRWESLIVTPESRLADVIFMEPQE